MRGASGCAVTTHSLANGEQATADTLVEPIEARSRPSTMNPSTSSSQRPPSRLRVLLPAAALTLMFALAGCSSGSQTDSSSSAGSLPQDSGNSVVAGRADSADSLAAAASPRALPGVETGAALDPGRSSVDSPSLTDPALSGEALIKTAAVTLESGDVSTVIAKIDELAAGTGGEIVSEDTSTNTHGAEVRSRIELSVPVVDFDRAVAEISRLGDLVSKSRSSQDVTSRVIDVSSRVGSAKDSIAQLRTLFNRATKLGDVIALERELADREANLEALQSQLRTLSARTTMSTITVNVSLPSTLPPVHHDQADGGFVTGIKQGWHGLVTFVVAVSHAVGLVLPLGVVALCAGLVAWVSLRRFMPRGEAHSSE